MKIPLNENCIIDITDLRVAAFVDNFGEHELCLEYNSGNPQNFKCTKKEAKAFIKKVEATKND